MRKISTFLSFPIIFAATLAAYFPILNNALLSDDYYFAIRTAAMPLSETWGLFTILPNLVRPLPVLVWWFQIHLFGGEGLPSHLIDIILHAGAGWALFMLISRHGGAIRTAIFSALLFVMAPVGPDAVAWSAARMDTMALLFVLLALFLYLNYLKSRNAYAYAGSLLAAAAALLSKEAALVLIGLMPAAEIIFGGKLPRARGNPSSLRSNGGVRSLFLNPRLRTAVLRQLPFFLLFLAYFITRLALFGGIGGYTDVIGAPRLTAAAMSTWTLLSPLNSLVFSRITITVFGLMTAGIWATSTFFVLKNWRRTVSGPRRVWLLFTVFSAISTGPIFWFFFVVGLDHSMQDSRFLYIPTASLIAMTVTGLLEFGPRRGLWQKGITLVLALAAIASLWGVRGNNRLWVHASSVATTVSNETQRLVPDPPLNSSFYYQGIDYGLGVHIFGNNLQGLIRWKYGRDDLRVSRLEPEIDSRRDAPIYFFSYDLSTDELRLTDTLPPLKAP